jgi:energy-coupling factor transporter ATP-binding protein EcfA2
MEALRRAWAEALWGHGGLVLLAGEAGVGKSRLAAELAGEVDAAGGSVLVGGCPAGGAEPYHPLVQAFGPLPPGHGADRDGVFEELAQAVVARAGRTPMLLVLDDLHRTDRSTALAIRKVVDAAAGARLLVVGTYRDAGVDRSHPLVELLTAPGVERIDVDGLSAEDVAEMIGDAELGREVWRRSGGNPVAVGELLRHGALDGPAPTSFDELVIRRMATLRPPARKVLEAAAVAGSEFHVDVVARAAGIPVSRAPAALKDVAAAGFVVEEPAGPGDCRRFVHDMVRESVERSLDMLDRVELHRMIARALEDHARRTGAPAAMLAWHYRAAAPVGGSARALGHSAQAGDLAMEALAWEEAAVHYGHALAAAGGARPEIRVDLLLALGEAQRLAGETARARQAFLEAATLARTVRDGTRLARAALALGQVDAVWGEDHELELLAGEARSLLGEDSRPVAAARFNDFASDALYDVLDDVPVAPRAPASAPVAPATSNATAALLRARHVALAGPEHAGERLAAADEMISLAAQEGDEELAVMGRAWRVVDALELGQVEKSAADQAAHAAAALRNDRAGHAADAEAWVAMRAVLQGRVDDAKAAAAAAFARGREAGDPQAEESYLALRWWLALEWGTTIELASVAGECRARAASAGGRTWRAAAALALARNGELDLAAEELRRVTDHGLGDLLRDSGRLHPLACLAEVAWILGDGPRAAAVGPLVEPFADRLVVVGRGRACMGSVARACGLVAASARRWDDAGRHLQSALAVHQGIGALPLLARTRYEWSNVLLDRGRKGDRRRASEWRRKSEELATRLRMTRLLEELAAPRT